MKSLHFPFHTHRLARGDGSSTFHRLMHDDRFWAILTLVLFLALFIAMGIFAMKTGAAGTYSAPHFF